ncbi:MAG: matrixin family metalloprotease [Nanoarchaeota archaeon]|nr:matrixin family metalloprotease [Nanoarchaeota archaeon]MBU4086611.1 matrixin family metalloprotease [Nanoarchaeota archaeon]
MIKWVLVIVLVALIGVVGYLGYFVLVNLYSTPASFDVEYSNSDNIHEPDLVYSSVEQFYPNMRFKSSRISFYFGNECDTEKMERMVQAFQHIENKTGIEFYESSSGDIEIRCGTEYKKEGLFVAGEGGPTGVINGTLFSVITGGQILLLYSQSCSYNVEIHELLHVLGFGHSSNPKSVMYNLTSCSQVVDEDIMQELASLYSVPGLPDLYFVGISAVKRGNYLNLNFSVRNQGLEDAQGVVVELESDSGTKESFDFGEILLGEGRIFSVQNLRVSLNTKSVSLKIKSDGEELNDANSEVLLTLE